MIVKVENLNLAELDMYLACNEKQLSHYFEPDPGVFIAETPIVIQRALDNDFEPLSFFIVEDELDNMKEIIDNYDVPVYTGSLELLKHIMGYNLNRGVLCAMKRKPLRDINFIKNLSRIVVLEEVMNPTNVGAIFRSAAALGMDGILLTGGCADPLYRRSIRVSMGTVFQIPWTYIENYDVLKQYGFKRVSMALRKNNVLLNDPVLNSEAKLAVFMGSESEGLKPSTIDNSDYVVKIDMAHGVDSLNVAAASAVAFYELANRK